MPFREANGVPEGLLGLQFLHFVLERREQLPDFLELLFLGGLFTVELLRELFPGGESVAEVSVDEAPRGIIRRVFFVVRTHAVARN